MKIKELIAKGILKGEYYFKTSKQIIKERKEKYQQQIRAKSFHHDIAKEFSEFIKRIPQWKFEFMEEVFNFGKKISKECGPSLEDVELLANEILPSYVGGGMIGSFISRLS